MDWREQERLCRRCFKKAKRVFSPTESLSLDHGFCPIKDDTSFPAEVLSNEKKSALRFCRITNDKVVQAGSRVAAFMLNA